MLHININNSCGLLPNPNHKPNLTLSQSWTQTHHSPRHVTHSCSVQNHLSGMNIMPWLRFVTDVQVGQRTGMHCSLTANCADNFV